MDGLIHLPLRPRGLAGAGGGAVARGPRAADGGRVALQHPGVGGPHRASSSWDGDASASRPAPPAEAEQLRQFAGEPRLDHAVKWAFVRIHPDDFERLIDSSRLEPDPHSAERLQGGRPAVERALRAQLPRRRRPPPLALVALPERGRRPRGVSLEAEPGADLRPGRAASPRTSTSSSGTGGCGSAPTRPEVARIGRPGSPPGAVDILHHNLIVRFEPSRRALSAVDTVRLRLLSPTVHHPLQAARRPPR